jgi:lysozyme
VSALARLGRWFVTHRRGEEVLAEVSVGFIASRLAVALGLGAGVAAAAVLAAQPAPTYHPAFTLSVKGIAFVERHEGVRFQPYNDPSARPLCTVGVGHVLNWHGRCTPAQLAQTYTPAQVTTLLVADSSVAQQCIRTRVTHPITQPQYDALVDLVFNAGCGSLDYRGVIDEINTGQLDAVPASLERTAVTAGGAPLPGLVTRRQDEAALFARGFYGAGIGYWLPPKPLTKRQLAEAALRARTGYWAWLDWRLAEGPWKGYAPRAFGVRPHVPAAVPAAWWRRERAFLAARHHAPGGAK